MVFERASVLKKRTCLPLRGQHRLDKRVSIELVYPSVSRLTTDANHRRQWHLTTGEYNSAVRLENSGAFRKPKDDWRVRLNCGLVDHKLLAILMTDSNPVQIAKRFEFDPKVNGVVGSVTTSSVDNCAWVLDRVFGLVCDKTKVCEPTKPWCLPFRAVSFHG